MDKYYIEFESKHSRGGGFVEANSIEEAIDKYKSTPFAQNIDEPYRIVLVENTEGWV